MCHLDEFSFIRYNTDYCGASSSPDHRVRKLIEFQKVVFIFNGDVIVIMGTTIVVPIYAFVGAKRGVAFPVFGS